MLTKPVGSLGRLEALAVQLADVQQTDRPASRPAAALVFAADHAVTQFGVSAYPPAVTRAMVANFVAGGAASSVAARHLGFSLTVVDVGVTGAEAVVGTTRAPVAAMTEGDLVTQDAMAPDVFVAAVEAGANAVAQLPDDVKVLILGEMGIGNTTLASAVAGATLKLGVDQIVGRGTGVDDTTFARKRSLVRRAIERTGDESPLEILRKLGGRELAAIRGAAEAAVTRNMVVLVDGVVVTASLLSLLLPAPHLRRHFVFAHRSADHSHGAMIQALDARPLIDLDLRLGEGTGAMVALPFLDMACQLHNEMATFQEADVPGRL
jgi:nicotinate-nucleotide--dimethylbenzimidazole phosphoribosyltransferase